MEQKSKNVTRSFMLLYIGFYIAQIVYFGILPSTLASFGYGETYVGYILTLMNASSLVLRLVVGYIVDKYSCPKGIIIGAFTFYAITQVGFFYFYRSTTYIELFALISLGFVGIVGTLCDSWVVKYREVDARLDYGKVRSCGSMSYAITGLITGQIIAVFGNSIISYFALIAWLVLVGAAVVIPNPPKIDTTKDRISLKDGLKIIIKEKPYLMLLFCTLLNSPAELSANSYYSVIVTNKGGTSSDVGLGLFVMAFSEFWVVYFYSKLAKKFRYERLFYLGCFGNAVRCLALALAPDAKWTVIAIVTQAISFALTLPGSVIIITKIVGTKYSTTAMQIYYVSKSLLNMAISTPTGWIAETYGTNAMLYVSMIPSIIGALILMFYTESRFKKGLIAEDTFAA